MFKGFVFLKVLSILGLISVYGYILYKMIVLNWFMNADFPTLIMVGLVLVAFPVVVFNVLKNK